MLDDAEKAELERIEREKEMAKAGADSKDTKGPQSFLACLSSTLLLYQVFKTPKRITGKKISSRQKRRKKGLFSVESIVSAILCFLSSAHNMASVSLTADIAHWPIGEIVIATVSVIF